MRIAVLPFNAGPGTRPALARQFANFIVQIASEASDAQIDAANYMAQVEEGGVHRFALVNPSEELNDPQMVTQFRDQSEINYVIDGLLVEKSGGGNFTLRVWGQTGDEPIAVHEFPYLPGGLYAAIRECIEKVLALSEETLPEAAQDDLTIFGTADQEAFIQFLLGYDSLRYIEQSQGNIVTSFDWNAPIDFLQRAIEADKDWEAPFLVLMQYCRISVQFRIGNGDKVREILKGMTEDQPDDSRVWFALGEFYEATNDVVAASSAYERSQQLDPEEPAIIHRLARMQLAQGMPVNAERNLRKAAELEGPDKPSLDVLSDVLASTGRAHEVAELWNDIVKQDGQNAKARARHAIALAATGHRDEAIRAFDQALELLEDNTYVKRYYAPILAENEQDIDRAMDFYEDCIDLAPADPILLWEYAQTLGRAGRTFEIPPVLKDILNTQADPTLRAHASAWLIEIEQPNRAELVTEAAKKLEEGDPASAVKDLKPLKNWLGDYWKLWMVLAGGHNRLNEPEDAEQAARRVLELLPSSEGGYVELNNALAAQGKHEEAYNLMRYAFTRMNESFPVAIAYVMACHRAGHKDEAVRVGTQIKHAMQGVEDNPEIHKIFETLAEVGVS